MSVVRKFTYDTDDGQEVRRSQSSVLVHDGDKMRVIEGPAQVIISRHGEGGDSPSPFPRALDDMVQRMRETMQRMMLRMRGAEEPELDHQAAENRQAVRVEVSPGLRAAPSGWRRVWRCTPHYVMLAVLLLGTALVLYTCYCLVCVVRRRRRRQQDALIQHEEIAEDLPPKYSLVGEHAEDAKSANVKDLPPAYNAIVADGELPPKLDV
ncbi:uncharacterized protein LOC119112348 [Pollicipes pollicipes]|nr:uncharacterized protein LOC119112348 [Pollicipes pollicipes]